MSPQRHGDERGFFTETYREASYSSAGIEGPFIQDNHAFSKNPGVLRGLHFQAPPYAQGKLVSCLLGKILDVVVDIRKSSKTYGHHVSVVLNSETGNQLFVPKGFAHGYLTLTPDCHVQYKVNAYYNKDSERGLFWNDPQLGINWQSESINPILSDKDTNWPVLDDLPTYFN